MVMMMVPLQAPHCPQPRAELRDQPEDRVLPDRYPLFNCLTAIPCSCRFDLSILASPIPSTLIVGFLNNPIFMCMMINDFVDVTALNVSDFFRIFLFHFVRERFVAFQDDR